MGSSVQFKFRGMFSVSCLHLPALTRPRSGTSVAVYGTVKTDTPSSAYTLDGTSNSFYVAPKSKTTVYQTLFYQSPILADGEHTLLVTNLGTGTLWIDYLLYTPSVSLVQSSSLPPSIRPSLSPTLTSHTVTPTPSQPVDTLTQKPSSSSSTQSSDTGFASQTNPTSKSSLSVPVVAGGVIGALVAVVLLIFGMLYYRKRAKRLAGTNLLEKKDIFGGKITTQVSPHVSSSNLTCLADSSELDKTHPGAVITPFTNTGAASLHNSPGYGGPNMDVYPPGTPYQPSDYGYDNQSHPSTPIYHFSNHYALRSGYDASDNITGVGAGTGPGYGGMSHMDSQYGGTHYEYPNSNGQADYLPNPHSQYGGAQHSHTPSDTLSVPRRRGSVESVESSASLAYLSSDRVATNPSSPLPEALPGLRPTRATPHRTGKSRLVVYNDTTPA